MAQEGRSVVNPDLVVLLKPADHVAPSVNGRRRNVTDAARLLHQPGLHGLVQRLGSHGIGHRLEDGLPDCRSAHGLTLGAMRRLYANPSAEVVYGLPETSGFEDGESQLKFGEGLVNDLTLPNGDDVALELPLRFSRLQGFSGDSLPAVEVFLFLGAKKGGLV